LRSLKAILLIVLALYLAALLTAFLLQRKLMYFPPANYLSPAEVGLEQAVEVPIRSEAGDALLGWWIAPVNGKPVVMFFHGNGSAVYSNHDIYRDLAAQGYGVLGVGYSGYPGSDGSPSQPAIVAGAIAHYDFLIEQGIAPEKVVFYGTSLGSGVAAQLSKTHKPTLLISEAPFTSILAIAKSQAWFFPVSLIWKDKFQSDKALEGQIFPLIWMHGTHDTIIPIKMGQQLFDSYEGPKFRHIFQGGQHTNLWFLGGQEIVLEALNEIE